MKKLSIMLVTLMVFSLFACSDGGNSGGTSDSTPGTNREMHNYPMYDGVDYPIEMWFKPEYNFCPEYDRKEEGTNIKALFLRNDYKGEESYAFCYLGVPEGASKDKKTPAVLLVHGGGGTAYWQWVQAWVDRGYTALAIDTEGHIPLETGTVNDGPTTLYQASPYNTPKNSNYGDADATPVNETWMYYATSTAIIGNSLLHSLPYVNKQQIGICGISWGGVITSIVTGYDDRFAFSVPIYCTLNNMNTASNMGSYLTSHPNALVWDDDTGLKRVETPILFLAGINDVNQTADTVTKTATGCKNARISLVKGFLHSHGHALMQNEPFDFADEIIFGKKRMITFKSTLNDVETSGELKIEVPAGVTADKAYIIYTENVVSEGSAFWEFERLEINNNTIAYDLTAKSSVKEFYVYVVTDSGLITSTRIAKTVA